MTTGPLDSDAARDRLLADHWDLIEATIAGADVVAESFETRIDDRPATRNPRAIRGPLAEQLAAADLIDRFPAALVDAVEAAGGSMPAQPVAAPPYVAVTSTGPVLRATLEGGRLVVRIDVYRVIDDAFVRAGETAEDVVAVEVVGASGNGSGRGSRSEGGSGNEESI